MTKPRFKRAVLVVIDALRYDMVEWQHGLSTEVTPPYLNKLDAVRDLLKDRPRHSRLYRFVADAPTTTMQRLKGIYARPTMGHPHGFIDTSLSVAQGKHS